MRPLLIRGSLLFLTSEKLILWCGWSWRTLRPRRIRRTSMRTLQSIIASWRHRECLRQAGAEQAAARWAKERGRCGPVWDKPRHEKSGLDSLRQQGHLCLSSFSVKYLECRGTLNEEETIPSKRESEISYTPPSNMIETAPWHGKEPTTETSAKWRDSWTAGSSSWPVRFALKRKNLPTRQQQTPEGL